MKNLATIIVILFSVVSFSQSEEENEILIDKVQPDDKYVAGKTIKVNAVVNGDLFIAIGNLPYRTIKIMNFTCLEACNCFMQIAVVPVISWL